MDFYNNAHASDDPPSESEQDQDGISEPKEAAPASHPESSRSSQTTPSSSMYLFETQAAFNRSGRRHETDLTSISSILTQNDPDANQGEDNPSTPESDESDSGRVTPDQQQSNRDQALAGLGHAFSRSQPSRTTTRLTQTHDEFGRTFVEYKEREALSKIQAASIGEALHPGGPYQLAVRRHDDLYFNTGPGRRDEERAAVCAHINGDTHVAGECTICYRPPDYYDLVAPDTAGEEEPSLPTTNVALRRRHGSEDAVPPAPAAAAEGST